jgi:hypothetical protein
MVSGQETVFCWVPVPELTMVLSSVALFFSLPTYQQPTSRLLVGRYYKQPLPMYKPSTYLVVTYFPTYLPIHETYFATELVTKLNEVHPQLS